MKMNIVIRENSNVRRIVAIQIHIILMIKIDVLKSFHSREQFT